MIIDVVFGGEIVVELIGCVFVEFGVGYVFGVVGSGNFVVINVLCVYGVFYFVVCYEGGVVLMVDGFSCLLVLFGILIIYQGCGFMNVMIGIVEVVKSCILMIVLIVDIFVVQICLNFKID